jgi:hypothetical protein
LLVQPFLLLLIHQMSNQAAGHRSNGSANQSAFAAISSANGSA